MPILLLQPNCEIRGDGSYNGDDNDKGYYGTGQAYATTGYSAGGANKSQMRTHVLSNGEVIWDLSGNVWQWTDDLCGVPWNTNAGWLEWTNSGLTDWEKYYAGPDGSLSSTNGVGKYYGCTADGNAFKRGGYWSITSYCGVFTLHLHATPAYSYTHIGFRCAR